MMRKQGKCSRRALTRGFTLVETIISMGLFIVVFGIAASAVISVHAISNRVVSTTGVIDSATFVLNDIVRNARLATKFTCGVDVTGGLVTDDDCPNSGTNDSFSFLTQLPDGSVGSEVTYRLNNGVVEKSVNNGIYYQLTSDRLTIDHLGFRVFDAVAGDSRPSRALITLIATYDKDTESSVTYKFQTTVTQRVVE